MPGGRACLRVIAVVEVKVVEVMVVWFGGSDGGGVWWK